MSPKKSFISLTLLSVVMSMAVMQMIFTFALKLIKYNLIFRKEAPLPLTQVATKNMVYAD